MEQLQYTYNWNNKLNCKAFVALRVHDPKKHSPGNKAEVILKDIKLGVVEIVTVNKVKIDDITDAMAYLDSGFSKEECVKDIRRMNPTVNFERFPMAFIVLKYIDEKP